MSYADVLSPKWRLATAQDLLTIDCIADQIHTGLPERPEVFAEKQRLFPIGCQALQVGDLVVGYGISHPWMLFDIPPLDAFLKMLPANSDCLYIHDVAVLPKYRGSGAAGAYVKAVEREAYRLGIAALALVSVYDTHPMWAKHGFRTIEAIDLCAKLRSYGPTAKYMVSSLTN